MHACVCVRTHVSVTVCTSNSGRAAASNWGDWDLGAPTTQIECLRPAAGGNHCVYMERERDIYTHTCFVTSGPATCSARENRMRLLVMFVFT